MKYKIGQRFTTNYTPERFNGYIFEIINIDENAEYSYYVKIVDFVRNSYPSGNKYIGYANWWKDCGDMTIINDNPIKNMSLISKAALLLKGEPEKSFIKAGVMDSSEMPTDEGIKLVVMYLLKNDKDFSAKFKTEVVDPILAEDAKK